MKTAKPTQSRDTPILLVHQFLESSAALTPRKIAVVHEGSRASYAEINASANRLARSLAGEGVVAGDRVVLLSENGIPYVVSYYGILKAGAIVASLNTDIKPEALGGLIRELEPRAVVVSTKLQKTVRALEAPILRGIPVVVLGYGPPALISAEFGSPLLLPPSVASLPQHDLGLDIDPGSCAAIIYTSGSAGKPKGAMLSHANIVANTRAIIEYLELTPSDIQMVVLPFFYVMGKSLLNTHVAVGGRVVINNKFAYTAAVLEQMAAEKVTGFSGVPSTYAHLLFKSPLGAYRDRLPALR